MPWHVATLKIKYMGLIYHFHSNSFIARNSATWQSHLVFFLKMTKKMKSSHPQKMRERGKEKVEGKRAQD